MTVEEIFQLTPEERLRLQNAPWRGTDEGGYQAFAAAIHTQVVKAYSDGEITLQRALEVTHACSIGCRPSVRAGLLALTAKLALDNPPTSERKRQPNPTWLRYAAASLVQMFIQDRPGETFAPNAMNDYNTQILSDAIDWLVTLRLCERVSPRTLYAWYLEAKDAGALETFSSKN